MAKKTVKGKASKVKSNAKRKQIKVTPSKSAAKRSPAAPRSRAASELLPSSTDIRRAYMKSLLSDYLGKRG